MFNPEDCIYLLSRKIVPPLLYVNEPSDWCTGRQRHDLISVSLKTLDLNIIPPLLSSIICSPTFTNINLSADVSVQVEVHIWAQQLLGESPVSSLNPDSNSTQVFSEKLSTKPENYSWEENKHEEDQPEAQLYAAENVGVENHRWAQQVFLKRDLLDVL